MKRLDSIDLLRATAILLMVQVHFADYLAASNGGPDWLWSVSTVLGSLAAPIFTFLVGMSLCLSLHKQAARGHPGRDIARRTVKRSVAVFVVGLVFLLLIWGPEEVFTWDILTFIGFALLALYPLRRLPPGWLLLLAALVILVSPWLRELARYPSYWDAAYTEYHAPTSLKHLLRGLFVNGYFPVLPWLVFPLVGFATARLILLDPPKSTLPWLPLASLGLLGLGVGLSLLVGRAHPDVEAYSHLSPLTFYPASTSYLLAVLGVILSAFWFLHTRLDLRPAPRPGLAFFRCYSRYSLTTYVVHHAAHIWPIALLGLLRYDDRWAYYADAVNLPGALGLAGLFVILFYVVLVRWDRSRGTLSLEWLLGKFVD